MTDVTITDIKMRFGSMVVFIIKWTLATICASLVLSLPMLAVWALIVAGL